MTHGESQQHVGGKESLLLLVGTKTATRLVLILQGRNSGGSRSSPASGEAETGGNRFLRVKFVAIGMPERVLGVPRHPLFGIRLHGEVRGPESTCHGAS